jgi:hypothetical protein
MDLYLNYNKKVDAIDTKLMQRVDIRIKILEM